MTDVDDKIVNRARSEAVPFAALAQRFEREFLADMAQLKVCLFQIFFIYVSNMCYHYYRSWFDKTLNAVRGAGAALLLFVLCLYCIFVHLMFSSLVHRFDHQLFLHV